MIKRKSILLLCSAALTLFLSCGDPFFLSYQVVRNDQVFTAPEGAKTMNGVTVSAVPDGYKMMYSEYAGFLVYVWNNSGKPVRIETGKITLKYSGQTNQSLRPKKIYTPPVIDPGEFCDMKASFELPYEAINVRGLNYTVEIEIPITFAEGEGGRKSEVFTFSSRYGTGR
jgi:hypothetical protein